MKYLLLIAFVIFLIIIGPFLTIWALNTLFPVLDIHYTLETWSAVILLGLFVRGDSVIRSSK
jgi:hypothetical protein